MKRDAVVLLCRAVAVAIAAVAAAIAVASSLCTVPCVPCRDIAWQKTLTEWPVSERFLPVGIPRGGKRSLTLVLA